MQRNQTFLREAQKLHPVIYRETIEKACGKSIKKGEKVCIDLGNHFVGYITLDLGYTGGYPDAPAWMRIKFAERLCELDEDAEQYHGWISASWVQQEQFHIDTLPCKYSMPRRYAFRYVQIEALDLSDKYAVAVNAVTVNSCTSANDSELIPYSGGDGFCRKLDRIACRTLRNCMQDVFEDGPKRDRRLWLGDLRLEAVANYQTYKNYDLVKRCLYLFAGCAHDDGMVGSSIFTADRIEVSGERMLDYSLFFVSALLDYYEATGDRKTAKNLWGTAVRQLELARERFDGQGVVRDSDELGWCFVDWNLELNKQASAQGIYLYSLLAAEKLAAALKDKERLSELREEYAAKKRAAIDCLFDKSEGLFVSGKDRQISWASQIWMVLGGAADATVLDRIAKKEDAIVMVTPYLYHHYIQALIDAGRKDQALDVLKEYWGGMVQNGADTFWELYNPDNPAESPYGGTIVNSYCHAWSCAPAYFLRKYYK